MATCAAVPPARLSFPTRPRLHAGMRATDRTAGKKNAERRFPHRVDGPVPGGGLGRRLAGMVDWRHANIAAGPWANSRQSCEGAAL